MIEDTDGESTKIEDFIRTVAPGPIHLFFGCRNENDYLYRDVLENRVRDGTLTVLETAFSRKEGKAKVYVTDKIRERGQEIAELLMRGGGYVFICGDGNHMAKDVHKTLVEILVTYEDEIEDVDAAEEVIEDLKFRRRFTLDIWS